MENNLCDAHLQINNNKNQILLQPQI